MQAFLGVCPAHPPTSVSQARLSGESRQEVSASPQGTPLPSSQSITRPNSGSRGRPLCTAGWEVSGEQSDTKLLGEGQVRTTLQGWRTALWAGSCNSEELSKRNVKSPCSKRGSLWKQPPSRRKETRAGRRSQRGLSDGFRASAWASGTALWRQDRRKDAAVTSRLGSDAGRSGALQSRGSPPSSGVANTAATKSERASEAVLL